MSSAIVEEIRLEIRKRASPERAERARGYFKEPIEVHGLSAPQEKEIAKKFYPRVRGDLPLTVEVAGELIESRVLEDASVGIRLLRRMTRRFTPETFDVFDGWIDHLTNWANTDGLGT